MMLTLRGWIRACVILTFVCGFAMLGTSQFVLPPVTKIVGLLSSQERVLWGIIPAGLVSNVVLSLKPDQNSDLDLELWNADGTNMLIGFRSGLGKGKFLYGYAPVENRICEIEGCKEDIFDWSGVNTAKGGEEYIKIRGPQATGGHLRNSYQVRVFCNPLSLQYECNGEVRFEHQSYAILWGLVRGPNDEPIEAELTLKWYSNNQPFKTINTDKDGAFITLLPPGQYYQEVKPVKPLGYRGKRDPDGGYINLEGGSQEFRFIQLGKLIPCVGTGDTKTGQIIVAGEAVTVHIVDPYASPLVENKLRLGNVTITLEIPERPYVEHDLLLRDPDEKDPKKFVVGPGGAVYCTSTSCSTSNYRGDKIWYSGAATHPEEIKIADPVKNYYHVLVVLRKKDDVGANWQGQYQVKYQCEVKSR